MRNELRKVHINNKDVWYWKTSIRMKDKLKTNFSHVIIYNKLDNNKKISADIQPFPSEVKNFIINQFYKSK